MTAGRNVLLDFFFIGATWLGSLWVLVPSAVAMCGVLIFRGRRMEALLLAGSLAGAAILSPVVKRVFVRARPEALHRLIPMPQDASFPSTHTAQITAISLAAILIACRLTAPEACVFVWIVGVMLILLVGISRVYLEVHYPSDVAGGAILSVLWVFGLYRLMTGLGILD
ncbi:MAG: phosphatase PAP2 family protein [Desulfobacterales bacterium]